MTDGTLRHALVLGDSLAFHGPDQPYRPSDPRLYPNTMAAALGTDVRADLVARLGWTARDAGIFSAKRCCAGSIARPDRIGEPLEHLC